MSSDLTKLNNGILEPNNICPNCKKSYPEVTFPPMDGDNLCNDCFSKQEDKKESPCNCFCHNEFDTVIICAHCPCRNVTKEEWKGAL
ncbi:MAG: hypothetical protein O6761_00365 [Thaumarchaeota archaeon]|nr:hypothetical protein [Nitrososphaerota archaeon]